MFVSRPIGDTLRAMATTLRVGLAISLLLLVLWALAQDLLLVFLCILLAALFRGLSDPLARLLRLPPMLALTFVVLVLFGAILALAALAGPQFVTQAQTLGTDLTQQYGKLHDSLSSNSTWGHALDGISLQSIGQSVGSGIATRAAGLAGNTLGALVTSLVVLVVSLYFAIAPDLYLNGAVLLVPPSYRDRMGHVLRHAGRTLQWWLLGQSVDMALVGLFTFAGLHLLGVHLALALAVLAGLFTFVPYFGAIAAAVPAMLVALEGGWQAALWVLLLFIVAHTIEGYLVSPLVQRRTVHMPPALTILSMTILGTLAGGLGLVLAAPLAAIGLVLVREMYVEDVLHERAGRTRLEEANSAPHPAHAN